MKSMRCCAWGLPFFLTFLIAAVLPARADDDVQGQPAPESADQLLDSFDRGLEGESTSPIPWDEIAQNSHLKLKLRNYYLNRAKPNNSTDPLAWAQGGSLEYNVDKIGGIFGLNLEYFESFKLYGPDDQDGTLLLESGQNNIDTFGVVNPRLNFSGNVVSLYRQKIDLPYVNQQDNRMIPNTFEGYLVGMPKAENATFQYVTGYISSIKKRNDDQFTSMSEAAGASDQERGMILAGARYYLMPELSIAGADYYVEDILNVSYFEATHKIKIDDSLANSASGQFSTQNSVGQNLLRDDNFSTSFWGLQDAVSYNNVTLKGAFTYDDTGGDLRSPWGSYPGYNSVIVEDFNRAGEKSWQINLAYNFGRFGLKGLGLATGYTKGLDAINEVTKDGLPDKDETDVTLDYKVQEGMLKGFWVRLRSASVHEDGRGTTEDYRIIVNYELPLYEPEKAPDAKS